jgi:DNA-binding NtrC family response regulator
MPTFTTIEKADGFSSPKLIELSAFDRVCVSRLIGHTLARIERELIVQTLRRNNGNRTHTANLLGISVRGLRQKILCYKARGERIPEPARAQRNSAINSPTPPSHQTPRG